jgi:hypothetical protein
MGAQGKLTRKRHKYPPELEASAIEKLIQDWME